jgi:uncharacterized protein (DUF697 family)
MTKLKSAKKIVNNYTTGSMGTGFIPIPFVDQIALIGIQRKMLHELTELYELPFSKDISQSILRMLLKMLLSSEVIKAVLGNLIKFIPGIGTAVGGLSASIFNSASTYAVGQVFIQHFESGGTLLTFKPEKMQTNLEKKFKERKQKAKDFEETTSSITI